MDLSKPLTAVKCTSTATVFSTMDELRAAQFALDVQLHDLRTEFLNREAKLRDEYLERVAAIAGEAA